MRAGVAVASLATALVAIALVLAGCQQPSSAQAAVRQEKDKTPYPCKDKYADDEVASWVAKHLEGAKGGHSEPQLLLMMGGSGAGKGTFIDKWREAERTASGVTHPLSGFIFHGLDEYLPYVAEYQKTIGDTAFVYKDAADACYGPAAIPAAKLAGEKIVSGRMDLIYEETGKSLSRIMKRVLPSFTQAGYRVTTVLIHNQPEIAISRSAGRFQKTGRYAPPDYINGTFANNLETFTELKKVDGLAEFVYCDNSGAEMKCWRDGLKGAPLVPNGMVLDGSPVLMGTQAAAPKPAAGKGREAAPPGPAAASPAAGKGREAAAKPAAEKPAAGKGREPPPPAAGKGRGAEL